MNTMIIDGQKATISYDEDIDMFRGKFNVRLAPELHADVVAAAKSKGESLNQFVAETLEHAVQG